MRKHRMTIYRVLLAALFICTVVIPVGIGAPAVQAAPICDNIPNPPTVYAPAPPWIASTGATRFQVPGVGFYDQFGGINVLVTQPQPAILVLLPNHANEMRVRLANLGPGEIMLHFTNGMAVVAELFVPPTDFNSDEVHLEWYGIDWGDPLEVIIYQGGSTVLIEEVCRG